MKINDMELEIIKNYVIKSKQERIIWEFENSEKRKSMMMTRFSGPDILKSNCLESDIIREKSVAEAHRDIC